MGSILLLCLLVMTTSASMASDFADPSVANGNSDQHVGLRGWRDLKGHKGPHGSFRKAGGRDHTEPYIVPEPQASPHESASPQTPQKQHRRHRGKMDVKNSKVEHAKKPNPKRWAHPPARSPTPNPAGQAQSYSYEAPAKEEPVEQGNEHHFRMEPKKGHAKKQNRKHAQNDPPAPSPALEDVPPPPSPTGTYSTNGLEEEVTSNSNHGNTEWEHAKKGHGKKEHAKKNEHTKKGHGRKGGEPGAPDNETAPMNAEMKPKKAHIGKKKREPMYPSEVAEEGADDFRGWNVDAKEKNKKGGHKHKNKKKETGASEMKYLPEEKQEARPVGAGTPQSEVKNLQVTDAPNQSEVKNLQVTDAPTPAPVTDKPTTEEPTTLAPFVPVVVTPLEEPTVPTTSMPTETEATLPACPPAWDPSKTSYVAGEYTEVQSHIFQCHALYEEYCNVAEWDDSLLETNPNAKVMWNDAWTHIEPCADAAARGDE